MKNIKYIMFAFVCCLFTGCLGGEDLGFDDDWDAPDTENVYGNNDIEDTNVITIAELKEKFKSYINTSYSYKLVDEDIKIKAYVTGNDISGNIYNEIPVQDETGAIIIAVAQGGIYGYLPVGTEILIDLKGLYIGNYGLQAEIGTPYTNSSGKTYVSRMNRFTWQQHFKITGNTKVIEPELFADGNAGGSTTWDIEKDSGKLGVIKNVSIRGARPTSVFADPNGNTSVSWYFNEFKGSTIMIYTSPYSDFANRVLPQGKCNITGIVKRYNDKWEIIIRDEKDIEEL